MSKPTFLDPLIGRGARHCRLVNAEDGSVLASHVEQAFDSTSRKKGLLGRQSIPDDYALVIAPCGSIHTFFMRCAIDAVFVSRDGTVVKICRALKPWRLAGSMTAFAVIEAAPGFVDRHGIVRGEVVAVRGNPPVQNLTDARPTHAPARDTGAGAVLARHTTSRGRLTLANIVVGGTPLAWFESVAIVQELCDGVLAQGPAAELRVPELKHIELTADGRVVLLHEGPSGHSPVQRIGLVLIALSPEEQLPVPLRLLVLEEVSPRPRLASLEAFQAELAFFERPDRRKVIEGVVERYQESSAAAVGAADAPAPLLEPPPPRTETVWRRRKGALVGLAAALLVALALASAWEWREPRAKWLRDGAVRVSALTAEGARKARDAAKDGLAAARRAVGFETKQSSADLLTAGSSANAVPGSSVSPPLTARPVSGTPDPRAMASSPPPVGLPEVRDSGIWEAVGWLPGTPVEPAATASEGDATAAVFTAANAQVVAPALIRPKISRGGPRGAMPEELPEVELVISTLGEVESAKFVTPASGAKAAMMLSAIKAWQFQPANLDGKPVRFRIRIRLVG